MKKNEYYIIFRCLNNGETQEVYMYGKSFMETLTRLMKNVKGQKTDIEILKFEKI